MALTFPEGIETWPIEEWENAHQNFAVHFTKDACFKLTLPDSLPNSTEKYKATTANFMWLIQHAIGNNIQMRAMGSGWSFTDVAVCPGGVIDTKSLRLSFALRDSFVAQEYRNSGKKSSDLFLVQCGMSILQLNEKLEAGNRSLKASGASNGQSIAGATSTGTHGSAFKVGAVHDTIVGLHIITGANRHVWLEKKSNPIASDEFIHWLGAEKITDDDIFNAAVVSFGSFGFIHGILIETESIFLLEEHRSGQIPYDQSLINAVDNGDFSRIQQYLPYPVDTPDKELYHFEVLINPHKFEPGNASKGVFFKVMYKTPYTANYPKRQRDSDGFTYGENTLGLVETILDSVGPVIAAALVPPLVNKLMPLAFKPIPPAFGTIGETFNNTKFRGKAASAAIGINRSDASKVVEEIISINRQIPFPGALALRFVKGSQALLAFTKYQATCVLEMDGVDCNESRIFFEKVWECLEGMQIPYTLHWGKFNFNLNIERIKNMYGETIVDKWMNSRDVLMDSTSRKVFTNDFMERFGLSR